MISTDKKIVFDSLTVKDKIKVFGFCKYKPTLNCNLQFNQDLEIEFHNLEKDIYASEAVNRYRRYGNGLIMPWAEDNEIHWMPTIIKDKVRYSGYDQGINNPEYTSMRYFNSISGEMKSSKFLNELILDDFKNTFWNKNNQHLPIYFGVHFVKLEVSQQGESAISSPNCFHQDGEPFTFAHLISRSDNTLGGVNYISSKENRNKTLDYINEDEIIESFTLTSFLESYAVNDSIVSHYVSPIFKEDDSDLPATRCMILIDFSQMKQVI